MRTLPVSLPLTRTRGPADRRRGVMAPFIAFLLPMLMLFLGFAVDLAYMQAVRMEVRAASDASARAGAATLSESGDQRAAEAEIIRVAAANEVGGKSLRIGAERIEFGRNERTGGGRWTFRSGASPPNAVRVDVGDAATTALFFGRLIGTETFQPTAASVAGFVDIDICLVLDRSTSMKVAVDSDEEGLYTSDPRFCQAPNDRSRWLALDAAVKVFTQTLSESAVDEQVAIATYSSALDPAIFGCGVSDSPSSLDVQLTTDMSRVDGTVDSLSTSVWNGNTFIEAGMRTGLGELVNGAAARPLADRFLIVLTDGNQNEGDAEAAADDAADENVTVHTITFSEYANQDLMKSVASRGGGRHYHADTPEQLREVFRQLAAIATQLTN